MNPYDFVYLCNNLYAEGLMLLDFIMLNGISLNLMVVEEQVLCEKCS